MIDLPRSDLEKQKILAKIAQKFETGKNYSEFEVNNILRTLKIEDVSLVRRELINFNYFGKDSVKGIYWLKTTEFSEEQLKNISENQKNRNL